MKCLFYFFWYRKYWHPGPARSLFEVQKLHVEDEGGVRRNGSRNPLSAVAHVRTDGQLGSLALGHLGHAVVPASDDLKTINNKSSIQCHLLSVSHLAPAQTEGEGLAPVPGAVHLRAVGQSQHVVTVNFLARLGEVCSIPRLESLDINTHPVISCEQTEFHSAGVPGEY